MKSFILSRKEMNQNYDNNDDGNRYFVQSHRSTGRHEARKHSVVKMSALNPVILCLEIIICQGLANGFNAYPDDMKIGDDCEGDDDCSEIPNAWCNLSSEMCACRGGHVPSSNDTLCLKLANRLGEECEISEQCKDIAAAKCKGGKCISETEMSTIPKFLEQCENDSECSSPKQCLNGTCVEILRIPDLHILGRVCNENSECLVNNSLCMNQKCQCIEDYVASQNLKSCLTKADSFGEECIESVQCLALNGVCLNQKCAEKITDFFKEIGVSNDKMTMFLGSSCETNDECNKIANAICKENVCECIESHVASISSDFCWAKSEKEGDECEVDKQCENIPGSVCSNNKCVRFAIAGRSLSSGARSHHYPSAIIVCMAAIVILKALLSLN